MTTCLKPSVPRAQVLVALSTPGLQRSHGRRDRGSKRDLRRPCRRRLLAYPRASRSRVLTDKARPSLHDLTVAEKGACDGALAEAAVAGAAKGHRPAVMDGRSANSGYWIFHLCHFSVVESQQVFVAPPLFRDCDTVSGAEPTQLSLAQPARLPLFGSSARFGFW